MGSRIRWFLTHGGAIVYNCLRLSSCADEGRADLLAILPSALYPHLTAVFHIYDTIQHFTLALGADRCRDIIERYIENILELSFTGRTFVVHVPFDQPLPKVELPPEKSSHTLYAPFEVLSIDYV